MPTYVYRCLNCEERHEAFQKMTDAPLTTCEECGGSLRRVLQPVGIVFKGSGFYTTDYKRAETGSNGKSAPAENGKSDSGSVKSESTQSESTAPKPAAEKKETTAAAS